MNDQFFWPLLALCLTTVGIWLALRTGLARRLALDTPSARSLHSRAMPRSGGIVMFLVIALCSIPVANGMALPVGLALMLACVSLLDDRYGLSIPLRLAIHCSCASLAVWLLMPDMPLLMKLVLMLIIVWSINLYNFMDGANGLAGGAALIGFSLFGGGFMLGGHTADALVCWIVAFAALGFLFFNSDPARIFMGDAGSVPLGFLAGLYAISGWQRDVWPAWLPLLVFSPLLIDASLTLLRRAACGEPFWQAHREHVYQRLIRMGWSHRRVATAYHVWMLWAGGGGLLLLSAGDEFAILVPAFAVVALAATLLAYFWADRRWRRLPADS